jgi:predicted dehydrogenase
MPAKARIAVIGTGWWSTYSHIPSLQANPAAELVAICDRDPQKLHAAARAYNIERTYEDYRVMLAQARPDGVVIATPHATHYAIAKACLREGLHVMLEKPMTLFAVEARELVDLARTRACELSIGYTYNYSPHALRAREVIRSGVLGPVQYVNCVMVSRVVELLRGDSRPEVDWRVFPVHGPGAVYSQPSLSGGGQGHLQLTHMAGLLFFVTGLRAQQVLALMRNHGLALDLVDVMAVEFEGGALGTVGGSGNAYQGKLDLQVHCERGSIAIDLVAGTTSIRGAAGLHEELERPSEEAQAESRSATINNLVDIILGKAANGAPGEVGWRAVELLDAAYRSAAKGGEAVTIESLYG